MTFQLKPPMVRVTSYKQSPLNHRQWLASLACGHEQWITARNPTAHARRCITCHKADPRVKEKP